MHNNSRADIVYLWVDGNDPVWRAKRRRATQKLCATTRSTMALYGNVEGRFRDNDELRYSLRALERFYPDHGHIYVVTDAQAPAWLQPSSRLTLIDHRELMPATSLPTFDSGNIESYIHRIAGLSERYFYFNDDVFFGAPVKLSDWFWDDGFYTAWSDDAPVTDEPLRADATSLENACRLSGQWLGHHHHSHRLPATGRGPERQTVEPYRHTFRTFAHAPRPMLKSLLFELEGQAPEMFAQVRSTVFRTWLKPTIVSDFVLRWALAHGVAKIRDYSHLYVSSGEADTASQLQTLVASCGSLDFFCVNDTTDDAQPHDPRLAKVRQALQQMFVQPSRFESAAQPYPLVRTARQVPAPAACGALSEQMAA
ncbi:MAG: exopolysaccharide phosphotransferase [Polaromonas sp.]|nr:MAG: exopolysaccharide phosphotransferase [Polaromonas sp.]